MRRLAVALVAVAVVTALAPAAQADGPLVVRGTDPAGDAVSPRGDLREWAFFFDSVKSRWNVKANVLNGENPVSAPSWHNTDTRIRVFWDTDELMAGAEFRTDIYAAGTTAPFALEATTVSVATGLPAAPGCTTNAATGTGATVKYQLPGTYRVKVPETCLVDQASVRIRYQMIFDPPPAGGGSTDRAPNAGWSPRLSTPG